jgi:hypothetical protein
MEQYKNSDGTYTSPKNNRTYKSLKAFTAHWYYAHTTNPNAFAERLYNVACQYCNKEYVISNHKRHEIACYLNPINIKKCCVCDKPIKNYKYSKGTCSHSCSNTHFKELRNKPEKYTQYATICWHYHVKECIVCKESNIVAVHHYNENHNDNTLSNLVPLCPTHHQYMHSRFKIQIQHIVDEYVLNMKIKFRE